MRIIAGTKRGMKLQSPKGLVSRPITDRVKESLFSVLYSYDLPPGAVVADLFCGVGSLGLEALSRGADFVTFIEQDPKIKAVLKKNIEKADFAEHSKIINANAFKIGAPEIPEKRKYNLVFIDPPYAQTQNVGPDSKLAKLMGILSGQVADKGLVVIRTQKSIELLDNYGIFEVIEKRTWSTMNVTMLRKKDEQQTDR